MSADYNVYVGWYIKVEKKEYIVDVVKYVDANSKQTDHKFDPSTGQPNKVEIHKESRLISPSIYSIINQYWDSSNNVQTKYDYLDEEYISSIDLEDYVVFLPNKGGRDFGIRTSTYRGSSDAIPTPIKFDPNEEAEFREYIGEYLTILELEYPMCNFEVEYGMVSYWS